MGLPTTKGIPEKIRDSLGVLWKTFLPFLLFLGFKGALAPGLLRPSSVIFKNYFLILGFKGALAPLLSRREEI